MTEQTNEKRQGTPASLRKWRYIALVVGTAALLCCVAALYYKEYIIATATGVVTVAQFLNYRRWKR